MSKGKHHGTKRRSGAPQRASDIALDAIERNAEFVRAIELVREGRNVFITGRAGTGKSTLLAVLRAELADWAMVVLAPTGVAALNVRGETVHRFCKFKAGVTLKHAKAAGAKRRTDDLVQALRTVVIDEVSMVRADLLDCLDVFLRAARGIKEPFGGVQLVLIGDCYQLPPVVKPEEEAFFGGGLRKRRTDVNHASPIVGYISPWFFSARVMREVDIELVELQKVYRQSDPAFIALLNAVRNRTVDESQLAHLNTRVWVGHGVPECARGAITLTPTNAAADAINAAELAAVPKKPKAYSGWMDGRFDQGRPPTDEVLMLKPGARVMFLVNDRGRRWVNGSIGTVLTCTEEGVTVRVDGRDEAVDVEPYTWEILESFFDRNTRSIGYDTVASFTQLPLRLAWAVTIHKAQGLTFDRVVLDLGRGAFAHGQTYVALSRCQSFEGITLTRPVKASDVRMDWEVVRFLTSFQYEKSEAAIPFEVKIARIETAIRDGKRLRITYLKRSDERSERVITPREVGEMEYEGKCFPGLAAYCHERRDERMFRVDRILTMEEVEE